MDIIDVGQVVKKIPLELHSDLSIDLMDLLLISKNGDKIPSLTVKDLLNLWRNDELSTLQGLRLLLETTISIEPQETGKLLVSKGFTELARNLGLEGRR
jgi:hypothetical protein